jgi:hypothetical protein
MIDGRWKGGISAIDFFFANPGNLSITSSQSYSAGPSVFPFQSKRLYFGKHFGETATQASTATGGGKGKEEEEGTSLDSVDSLSSSSF